MRLGACVAAVQQLVRVVRDVSRGVVQGVWSYVVGAVCTPTFIAVPIVTIWAGVFPIVLNFWAAIALTVYYISTSSVRLPALFGQCSHATASENRTATLLRARCSAIRGSALCYAAEGGAHRLQLSSPENSLSREQGSGAACRRSQEGPNTECSALVCSALDWSCATTLRHYLRV